MKKNKTLFIDGPWGISALLALFCFLGMSAYLVLTHTSDANDGYAFIFQARRLLDPAYSWHPLLLIRPRALVMVLAVWDALFSFFATRFPSLADYHALMAAISFAFVVAWAFVFFHLVERKIAYSAIVLLCFHHALTESAVLCLSDILAGLGWASLLLLMAHYLKLRQDPRSRENLRYPLLLGACGALAGTSKHQFFLLFPILLAIYYLVYALHPLFSHRPWGRVREQRRWIIVSFLSFLIGVDLVHRIFASPYQGVGSHLLYFVNLLRFVQEVTPWVALQNDTWLYVKDLAFAFGSWGVIFVLASGLAFCLLKPKARLGEQEPDTSLRLTMLWWMLVGSWVFFAAQTQKFPNKELRYEIPLLPVVVLMICFVSWRCYERLTGKKQLAYVALAVASFFIPMKRTLESLATQSQPEKYMSLGATEENKLWLHIVKPSRQTGACLRVKACEVPHLGHGSEWPFVYFHAGFMPKAVGCQSHTSFAEQRRFLGGEDLAGTCYVLRGESAEPKLPEPLYVQKSVGLHISPKSKAALEKKITSAKQSLDCSPLADGYYRCFESTRFF